MSDLILRQAAIDALWKALYEYEDKTEKQFIESDELDVGDWVRHRVFVENMSDIDRQVILNLPPAQPEQKEPCSACEGLEDGDTLYADSHWDGGVGVDYICDIKYCPVCGRKLKE